MPNESEKDQDRKKGNEPISDNGENLDQKTEKLTHTHSDDSRQPIVDIRSKIESECGSYIWGDGTDTNTKNSKNKNSLEYSNCAATVNSGDGIIEHQ